MFKIFGKSKKQSSKENKENVGSLKRDVLERTSTRSDNGGNSNGFDPTGRGPLDRNGSLNASMHGRAMRPAVINPYSVWTEEKKTKGPSSWAGGPTHEDRHYARPSTTRLRQHNLDAIDERPSRDHHRSSHSHNHSLNMPSSHSYATSHHHHHRMSTFNEAESEDDDSEYYARALEKKDRHIRKLKDEVSKLQDSLESKNDEIDSLRYEAANSRKKMKDRLESCKIQFKQLKRMLEEEKDKNEQLEAKMISMCCGSREGRSNGAEERLMSSSETSVEMSTEERALDTLNSDEVQDYSRRNNTEEECEKPRNEDTADQDSIRRCASDTLLSTSQRHPSMVESRHSGGHSRPHKEVYFPSQWDTSDSSDGEELYDRRRRSDSSDAEELRLREKQLTKIGEVVKYNPPRNKLHQKYYRRYGKHEISALGQFRFLETENTDVSGMLSSPDVTTYYH